MCKSLKELTAPGGRRAVLPRGLAVGLERFYPGGLTKKKIRMVSKCLHGLSIRKGGHVSLGRVPHGWGPRELVRSPYAG